MNRIAFAVFCPRLLVALFLTGLGGTSHFCSGAEPRPASTNAQPPTLDALVADVVEHNPELNFYRAEIAAAKGERRTAGAWANPEVSTTVGQKKVPAGSGRSRKSRGYSVLDPPRAVFVLSYA